RRQNNRQRQAHRSLRIAGRTSLPGGVRRRRAEGDPRTAGGRGRHPGRVCADAVRPYLRDTKGTAHMARLLGVDLPRDKRVEVALTYIFGIGRTRAKETLAGTGVNPDLR